jgi:hypothetical protein
VKASALRFVTYEAKSMGYLFGNYKTLKHCTQDKFCQQIISKKNYILFKMLTISLLFHDADP